MTHVSSSVLIRAALLSVFSHVLIVIFLVINLFIFIFGMNSVCKLWAASVFPSQTSSHKASVFSYVCIID